MASNDPTDTGGLFIGRRPGTGPLHFRARPVPAGPRRRRFDRALAALILTLEAVLLATLWGPQPMAWLWVGSQVDYQTDSVEVGIVSAFAGMMLTLFITLALAKRLDHAWKLARRAAGHEQKGGAIEWIFVVSIAVGVTAFCIWLFVIEGPGSQLYSPRAP
jgi:hypothetical protein